MMLLYALYKIDVINQEEHLVGVYKQDLFEALSEEQKAQDSIHVADVDDLEFASQDQKKLVQRTIKGKNYQIDELYIDWSKQDFKEDEFPNQIYLEMSDNHDDWMSGCCHGHVDTERIEAIFWRTKDIPYDVRIDVVTLQVLSDGQLNALSESSEYESRKSSSNTSDTESETAEAETLSSEKPAPEKLTTSSASPATEFQPSNVVSNIIFSNLRRRKEMLNGKVYDRLKSLYSNRNHFVRWDGESPEAFEKRVQGYKSDFQIQEQEVRLEREQKQREEREARILEHLLDMETLMASAKYAETIRKEIVSSMHFPDSVREKYLQSSTQRIVTNTALLEKKVDFLNKLLQAKPTQPFTL